MKTTHSIYDFFREPSLTRKITVVIVLTATFILTLSLMVQLLILSKRNGLQFSQKSEQQISILRDSLELPLWNYDIEAVRKLGQMIMSSNITAALQIRDNRGDLLFIGEKASDRKDVVHDVKIEFRGQLVGSFELSLTRKPYVMQQKSLAIISMVTLGVLVLGISFTVFISVRRFMKKPLLDFSRRIDALAGGNYGHELFSNGLNDDYIELRNLMDHFNQMAMKIELREKDLIASNKAFKLEVEERKKAESQLIRFATIIEQADESVIITDPEGVIQYVNPSFEKSTGFGLEEAVGNTPVIIKSGLHEPGFYENMWETILDKRIWKGIIKNKNKDGSIALHDTTITPITDPDEKISGFVSIRRDITKQKELEQQIQLSQKMQAIGTLAGGIAHDFNNILSGMFGYCHLAQANIHDSEKALKNLSNVFKAAQRASELVQQILTFSRQTEYEKQPFRIYIEINEALKLLRSTLPSTIEIKKQLDSNAMVMADPTKIHQVVMNLCTNAFHAMQETGGILTLSLTEKEIIETEYMMGNPCPKGKYLCLEVMDTGSGMTPDLMEKIFDPYFTTKESGQGTGLGLSIVQAIVEEHNGFLDLESTPGKGTRFYILFPVVEKETEPSLADPEMPMLNHSDQTLMIVDDEADIRQTFKSILGNYGFRIFTYPDGNKAFDAFKNNPEMFDLIITDLTMPGRTGLELIKEIRTINSNIPVILFSGYTESLNEKKAAELGINKFLMKPVMSTDLVNCVKLILEERKNSAGSA